VRVCEAVGETDVVTRGWSVEVLVGKGGVIVPLGTGETVSEVPVPSARVPVSVVAGEANGVYEVWRVGILVEDGAGV
jgi:hypothetical protein